MNGKHLALLTLTLLPALAHASAADYFSEEPLSENTSLSGREIDDETEVLTPQGIMSENTFEQTNALPVGAFPFDGPAAGIEGDISPAAGPDAMNPLYQPDVPGAPSGTPGPATSIAAPPIEDYGAPAQTEPAPATQPASTQGMLPPTTFAATPGITQPSSPQPTAPAMDYNTPGSTDPAQDTAPTP